MRVLSTSTRLVFLISAISLAAILALGSVVYIAVSHQLDQDTRHYVNADASDLLGVLRKGGRAALLAEVESRYADQANEDMVYTVLDARGQVLGGHPVPEGVLRGGKGWRSFIDPGSEPPQRVIATVIPLEDGSWLVSGMQTRAEDGFLQVMSRTAWLGFAVAVLLGFLMGWLVSRWVGNRLLHLDHVIARVGEGDLSARYRSDGSDDAFDRIGSHINRTLDRLVELMQGVRDVSDHIAHDLRTPLTRLRNRLSDAREASGPARDELVDGAVEETDQLLQTFAAMLRLSRLEHTPIPADQPEVQLDVIASDALELYEPLAQAGDIRLEGQLAPVRVRGDVDQLFQAIANLIDNAVKYSPSGGEVRVACGQDGAWALLEIADQGPGIPAAERERVFERFVRLEEHRGSSGNGLGLSLVRAVVQRHGGSVMLDDNAPGLRVRVRLPALPPSGEAGGAGNDAKAQPAA